MKRLYPAGIQSFESIRMDGYVYVDKTELIYKMITEGKPYFLSRPRRFGKSLLVSTLAAVFEGRRDLFEEIKLKNGQVQPGLFIAGTDWEWEPHPVLRFDFNSDTMDIDGLDELIDKNLKKYEQKYEIQQVAESYSERMKILIPAAHAQTGKKVVVLVDEYDKQMLHAIGNLRLEEAVRKRFQNLFSPLKELDDHLRFVFITGITKFSQMGIFSTLNNLTNISMEPIFERICGITGEELSTALRPDIGLLAEKRGKTYDETFAELKQRYDGYHFSRKKTDMYNPYSLMRALKSGEIENYWFESATPSAVIDMLKQMPPLQLSDVDGVVCDSQAFDRPFNSYGAPLPVLYQSGYLTIKDFDEEDELYTLGFPNEEVRCGFASCLYQYAVNRENDYDPDRSALLKAYKVFRRTDDLSAFIEAVKSFFAGVPYHLDNRNEHHYHAILYTLLTAFGADIRAEEPTAKGRADIVLLMPKGIYVMELKYDGTADEALAQIRSKGYAGKYAIDQRPVTIVGIAFSSEQRNITEWKSENET